jgi:hypothetical protein
MTLRLVALAFAVLSSSAVAQDFNRPGLVRGLCQKDGCDDLEIISSQPIARGPEGTLLRTRVHMYKASYQGRQDQGEQQGYIYCSSIKPAVIATDNSQKQIAFYLAPYGEKEPRETANFYAMYFAACHGVQAGNAAADRRQRASVAEAYGYSVGLLQSRMEPVGRAEEILGVSAAPPRMAPAPLPLDEEEGDEFDDRLGRLIPPRGVLMPWLPRW